MRKLRSQRITVHEFCRWSSDIAFPATTRWWNFHRSFQIIGFQLMARYFTVKFSFWRMSLLYTSSIENIQDFEDFCERQSRKNSQISDFLYSPYDIVIPFFESFRCLSYLGEYFATNRSVEIHETSTITNFELNFELWRGSKTYMQNYIYRLFMFDVNFRDVFSRQLRNQIIKMLSIRSRFSIDDKSFSLRWFNCVWNTPIRSCERR